MTKISNTIPKLKNWTFWKVTLPAGELEKPLKVGSQGKVTKLWTQGAVTCSSELLGRGVRCVTASANRARTQGTQTIKITRFDQSRSLTAPRYTILDGGIQAQGHSLLERQMLKFT